MSSPHLNNLIIVGCILTYSSVIFLGLDSQLSSVTAFPYICTARAWLLMAGFSLAFGSMFSKTWRVHSIFTDVKLNKKVSNLLIISHENVTSRAFTKNKKNYRKLVINFFLCLHIMFTSRKDCTNIDYAPRYFSSHKKKYIDKYLKGYRDYVPLYVIVLYVLLNKAILKIFYDYT